MDESKWMTLLQAAKTAGVSKATALYRMRYVPDSAKKRLPNDNWLVTDEALPYFTQERTQHGLAANKSNLNETASNANASASNVDDKDPCNSDNITMELFRELQHQLGIMEKKLAEKDAEILRLSTEITEALKRAQNNESTAHAVAAGSVKMNLDAHKAQDDGSSDNVVAEFDANEMQMNSNVMQINSDESKSPTPLTVDLVESVDPVETVKPSQPADLVTDKAKIRAALSSMSFGQLIKYTFTRKLPEELSHDD